MSGENKQVISCSGCGTVPLFSLFIVFLVLKLTDTVDWSWWIVTLPLWAPITLFLVTCVLLCVSVVLVFITAFIVIGCASLIDSLLLRKNNYPYR